MTRDRILNYACIVVLLAATLLGWTWVWGLIFIYWTVPSVMSGEAFLLTTVQRDREPVLFWAALALWALFGLMMVAASLFPQHAPWLV